MFFCVEKLFGLGNDGSCTALWMKWIVHFKNGKLYIMQRSVQFFKAPQSMFNISKTWNNKTNGHNRSRKEGTERQIIEGTKRKQSI